MLFIPHTAFYAVLRIGGRAKRTGSRDQVGFGGRIRRFLVHPHGVDSGARSRNSSCAWTRPRGSSPNGTDIAFVSASVRTASKPGNASNQCWVQREEISDRYQIKEKTTCQSILIHHCGLFSRIG